MGEFNDVTIDIGKRVFDGVAHGGLGGEVDYALELVSGKTLLHALAVTQVNT